MTELPSSLEERCVNTLRFLAVDAVERAGSGHPGTPMGAAAVAFTLWHHALRFDPTAPGWPGRDRFILSAGHAAMLLYGLLHCAGAGPSTEELRRFRQLGSLTPGHPERGLTPGVELTTGPLGQGFAASVGAALAAELLQARLGTPLAGYRVFCLASDGDLQEGLSYEAAALAGRLRLGNLVTIHDANEVTIEGALTLSSTEDVPARFRAQGWRVLEADGLDTRALRAALDEACAEGEAPTLIRAETKIGYGSPLEGDSRCHGAPLGQAALEATRAHLGWSEEPFAVPDDVLEVWERWRHDRRRLREAWESALVDWRRANPAEAALWDRLRERPPARELLPELIEAAEPGRADKGRAISGRLLQRAASLSPSLVGGCADLSGSTKARIEGSGWVTPEGGFRGRNVAFGVREHAMAAIANGLALDDAVRPFCSTYLVFSDYLRPSLRLAAQMGLPVLYLFTHDSVLAGQDGPTHQPVEHLWSLRSIPGVRLFRPADALEVAAAWAAALASRDKPHLLILARHALPPLRRSGDFDPETILRGGYLVEGEPQGEGAVTLAATGSEVPLALEVAEGLRSRGQAARVASLPCLELFFEQPQSYREAVIPARGPLVIIEAGSSRPWVGLRGRSEELVIGVDRFGLSAPQPQVAAEVGLEAGALVDQVEGWLSMKLQPEQGRPTRPA